MIALWAEGQPGGQPTLPAPAPPLTPPAKNELFVLFAVFGMRIGGSGLHALSLQPGLGFYGCIFPLPRAQMLETADWRPSSSIHELCDFPKALSFSEPHWSRV